jgi:hypothetical protein
MSLDIEPGQWRMCKQHKRLVARCPRGKKSGAELPASAMAIVDVLVTVSKIAHATDAYLDLPHLLQKV